MPRPVELNLEQRRMVEKLQREGPGHQDGDQFREACGRELAKVGLRLVLIRVHQTEHGPGLELIVTPSMGGRG